MTLSNKDKQILMTGQKLGYLSNNQVAEIYEQGMHNPLNMAQFLVQKGYLSAIQLTQILKIASTMPKEKKTAEKENHWGEFILQEKIGQGGMGEVYKALDALGKTVALKIIRKNSTSESAQKRFVREAKAIAQMTHPHVIPIYYMGSHDQTSYFTMRYINGGTFADVLQAWTVKKKIKVIIEVAEALSHAHDKQILHRDVKPSNILLDQDGNSYLADFGLAKMLDSESPVTRTGDVLGTPYYMPPEQTQGKKDKFGPASDIYSLGIVLYQALTGQLPFTADSLPSLYDKINHEIPIAPHNIAEEIPKELSVICLKAIEKSPNLRYTDAQEFADDLKLYLQGKASRTIAGKFEIKRVATHIVQIIKSRMEYVFGLYLCFAVVLGVMAWQYWKGQKKDHSHLVKNSASYEQALSNYQAQNYSKALEQISSLNNATDKKPLWLKTKILIKLQDWERLEITWKLLETHSLSAKELSIIAKQALDIGELDTAIYYYRQALKISNDFLYKLQLLIILTSVGRYDQLPPFIGVSQKQHPELLLAKASFLYYKKEYEKCLTLLSQIPLKNKNLSARVIFLRAKVKWHSMEELDHWLWLSNIRSQGGLSPEKRLREIEKDLEMAAKHLADYDRLSQLEKIIRQNHLLYSTTIDLEKLISHNAIDQIEAFSKKLAKTPLPVSDQVFLSQVIIRSLMRNKLWSQAQKYSLKFCRDYPWENDFYNYRSLILLQLGELDNSIEEVFKAIKRETWNFIPIENLLNTLFNHFTQPEGYKFWSIMVRYINETNVDIETLITDTLLEQLVEKYYLSSPVIRTKKVNWKKWFPFILQENGDLSTSAAINILCSHYNVKMEKEIMRQLSRKPGKKVQSNLIKLKKAIAKEKQQRREKKIKDLVIKQALIPENKNLILFRKSGQEGERILFKILLSNKEKPMMRFLAARTIASMSTLSGYDGLYRIKNSDNYPANIMAGLAIRRKKVNCKIENDFPQNKKIWQEPKLYQLLFAFYANPKKYPIELEKLMNSKDKLIAACAAGNCYGFILTNEQLFPGWRDKSRKCLLKLMDQNTNSQARSFALHLFWNLGGVKGEMPERTSLYQENWQNYGDILLRAMDSQDSKIQVAVISAIVGNFYYFRLKHNPKFLKIKNVVDFRAKLIQLSYEPEARYFVRFLSCLASSRMNAEKEMLDLMSRKQTIFFIRVAAIYGVFINKGGLVQNWMQLYKKITILNAKLESFAKLNPETREEEKIRQFSLYLLAVMKRSFNTDNSDFQTRKLLKNIIKNKKSPLTLKATALSSLAWHSKKIDIPFIQKYTTHDDLDIRRAAYASLTANMMKFRRTQQLNDLIEKLPTLSPAVQKSVGYGCYSPIQITILQADRMFSVININNYEYSMEAFRNKATARWIYILKYTIRAIPHDPRYHYELAEVYYKLKQYDKAQKQLAITMDLLKNNDDLKIYKAAKRLEARMYLQEGKIDKTLAVHREIAQKDLLDGSVYYAMAEIAYSTGNRTSFTKYIQLAYWCNPAIFIRYVKLNYTSKSHKVIQQAIAEKFPAVTW